MPTISMFYGIVIRMQKEDMSRHHIPHLHATYGEWEAVYGFDGTLIEGELPSNKSKLVEAWIIIHKNELEKNWNSLTMGENAEKISPLT